MNEGWIILGGVFAGALVVAEVAVRLVGPPKGSLLWRLGRGCSSAVKALLFKR